MRFQNVIEMPDMGDPHTLGRWWTDDAGRYIRHGCVGRDRAARRRAFCYLGMAEIVAARQEVTVRWSVRDTAAPAIMSAAHFLTTRAPGCLISLEYEWGAWNREVFTSRAAALARIATIGRYRHTRPFTGTKQVQRDLSAVVGGSGLLSAAFTAWERTRRAFSPGGLDGFGALAAYALAFRETRQGPQFAFAHIGAAAGAVQVFGTAWARTALGRRCDRSQPDFEYDERVCATYRQVSDSAEPVYDHILAVIRRAGDDAIWVPYRRLVLPMRDRLGAPIVVSVCDVTQDVDIPFMPA